MIQIESRKCINIRKIVEYLGTDVATKLPQIHAVTGFETTSLLHSVGEIKGLKKCLNGKEKLSLLNIIGVSSKFQTQQLKMWKSLFKLFATQNCSYTLNCKQLSVLDMKFITCQE